MNDDLEMKILGEMLDASQRRKSTNLLRLSRVQYLISMDSTHRQRFFKCVLERIERERLMPSSPDLDDGSTNPATEITNEESGSTALYAAHLAYEKAARGYVTAKAKRHIASKVQAMTGVSEEDKKYQEEQLARADEAIDNLIHHIQHASPEVQAALKAALRKKK